MSNKQSVNINKCKCGFPLPPPPRTFKESLIYFKQVIESHEFQCPECGKENIVRG